MDKFNSLIAEALDANYNKYAKADKIKERIKNIELVFNKEKLYTEFSYQIDHILTLKWTKVIDDPIKFRLILASTEDTEKPLLECKLFIREKITEDILCNFLIELINHINSTQLRTMISTEDNKYMIQYCIAFSGNCINSDCPKAISLHKALLEKFGEGVTKEIEEILERVL